jgi:predicted metal-binding membrane protein
VATAERPSARSTPWPTGPIHLSIGLILAGLTAFSALSWVLTAGTSRGNRMMPGLTGLFGMDMTDMPGMNAAFFTGMWVTMMVAMMFPSVAPMVVAHWRISRIRRQSPLAVPLFVGGYLLSWTVIGIGAYWAYRGILSIAPSLSDRTAGLLAGGILAGAGAYQLSKLKSVCLRHCRNPLEFFMHWKPGLRGASRMGVEHGVFCVGCCWGLMIVLFVVGLMNLAWMGVIAAVIFVEKVAPFGWKMARGVGISLIALGIAIALFPVLVGSSLLGG